MEIGSEFWWDSDLITSSDAVCEKISNNNYIYTESGRGAINLILENLDDHVKGVQLPSYICESVIQPFLENNYNIFFYNVNLDLSVDINSIKNMDKTSVFFHLGYYGFYTNSEIKNIVNKMEKDLILIEDKTHTLLSQSDIDNSKYTVASLRKWLGLPSGGFATGLNIKPVLTTSTIISELRKKALILKEDYIKNDVQNKAKFLKMFDYAEVELDKCSKSYKIDSDSLNILKHTNFKNISDTRRENFLTLLRGLENVLVEPIFSELPDDVVPLFFPIYSKQRNKLRNHLINNEIYCPIHWPKSEMVEGSISDDVQKIYDEILSIPIDQRYGISEMERIIQIVNNWKGD
ncbi:hypothetical protein ACRCJP_08700 [Aerococcus urinaeequi]|uniref:hypothetical protein n=1 Tax=Aerococcus urinaeequi TaxID=51665 RepID=UPI003B45E0AB